MSKKDALSLLEGVKDLPIASRLYHNNGDMDIYLDDGVNTITITLESSLYGHYLKLDTLDRETGHYRHDLDQRIKMRFDTYLKIKNQMIEKYFPV